MNKAPTKKEKEFVHFIMDKMDKELKEIWDAYRIHQYDYMREEIQDAVKKIRREYE